ncbi:MAG: heme biosynthesis protein HemY [Kangiellaceae bacterium]|nr:heme biosynthesis protein HemY [Kangiellaceae bacterium]
MKLKWWLLLGLFGGPLVAYLIKQVPGSTYIVLDQTAIEFQNNFAIALLILAGLGLWLLWLLVRYILRTSNLTVGWFGDRGLRKAQQNTIDGMIALAEGHWKTAEKLLTKGAQIDDTKLINYLAAARAAQEQNLDKNRDDYLKAAAQAQPEAQIAVGLTQAQLQLQHKQYEQALATLNHLRSMSPHHPYVLKLLNQLFNRLQDWQQVIELCPKLRKNRVLSSEQLDANEINAWLKQLEKENALSGFDAAQQVWKSSPKIFTASSEAQLNFAKILAEHQQQELLESHIKNSMKQSWQDELAQLFGDIHSEQPAKTLASAEQWLKQKPQNVSLLTALGKLSLQAQLWGKSKSYLEQSIQLKPSAEAYFYLAQAFEQLGHPINAQEQYQSGLLHQVQPKQQYDLLADLTQNYNR